MSKNIIDLCLSVDAIVRHEGFKSLEVKILDHDGRLLDLFFNY